MELALYGLGRMGLNMARRLLLAKHRVVASNRSPGPVEEAVKAGAARAGSLEDAVRMLKLPRTVWLMIPAGPPVDEAIATALPLLGRGDVLVDGGNSFYKDSIRRHEHTAHRGVHYLDAGVSGGIWGLEVGYCTMVGGDREAFERLRPIFESLAPKDGYAHVGGPGAGHFTKMVHNGIEYGMMQAYAEGFELLRASGYGMDLAAVSALWNRGSVVRSWLLELAERAFRRDPELSAIRGWVEDSGEGRWTVIESVEKAVPAPVISASLQARFRSRQDDSFGAKVLAALRNEFGGHAVKKAT
jgi:6-phosphogluconate dehydrogenase